MGLEVGDGFISGLVATNPVGATDPKSQGDDHIRLIKAAILGSFPNVAGAVTADHTELSLLDGATGVTGTGKLVLDHAPTIVGTLTADTFAGSGASLTALNASSLASGTVPDARFPSTLPALNGAALTALNATNIASGSLADARLSANVPLLNAANTFTGASLTVSASNSFLRATDSAVQAFMQALGAGSVSIGSNTAHPVDVVINGVAKMRVDGSGNFDFKGGTVSTSNASAAEVGKLCTPQISVTSTGTTVLDGTHAGKQLYVTGSGAAIRCDGVFTGFACVIINNSGGAITLTENGTSLWLAGSGFGSHGTRTIANSGIAYVQTLGGSTSYVVSGVGVS